jgi:hypothetical protein
MVFFGNEVATITDHRRYGVPFTLRVICKQLYWQIGCAAQICSALMPTLSGVQKLWLGFDGPMMPTEWENGEIDGTNLSGRERAPYLRRAFGGAFSCAAGE